MTSIRKGRHRVVAALAFICALGAAVAAEAAEFRIRGTGMGGGSPYEGRVVTDVVGNTVKVVWVVGSSRYTGNGVIDGDALAIYFTGPTSGVALYKLDPSTGVFRGKWTTSGSNQVGTEDWFPVK